VHKNAYTRINTLILVLFCTLFISCSPQRRLTNLLTRFPDLIDTTEVVTTIYKDTIIFVPVLGTDTVYKWSTILDTVYASSGTAHSISYVTHDTLKLFVFSSDTLVTYRLDSLKMVINNKDVQIKVLSEQESKFVKAISQIGSLLLKVLIIIAVIAVIIVIIPRIFKKK
jgi:subtilase family serine protease